MEREGREGREGREERGKRDKTFFLFLFYFYFSYFSFLFFPFLSSSVQLGDSFESLFSRDLGGFLSEYVVEAAVHGSAITGTWSDT